MSSNDVDPTRPVPQPAWRAVEPAAQAAHRGQSDPLSRAEPRGAVDHLSRAERIGLSLHRGLDKWLTPLGIWVMRRTRGGVARRWKVDALLLTTRGRRSGRERTVVLQFFPDGDAMVVAAANDGGTAHPGWYFNLQGDPAAQVEIAGRTIRVRAEELSAEAAAEWWQRIVRRDPSYERYTRATSRAFPILRLVPNPEQLTDAAAQATDAAEQATNV